MPSTEPLKIGDRVVRKRYTVMLSSPAQYFVTDVSDDGARAAICKTWGGKPQNSRWYPVRELVKQPTQTQEAR